MDNPYASEFDKYFAKPVPDLADQSSYNDTQMLVDNDDQKSVVLDASKMGLTISEIDEVFDNPENILTDYQSGKLLHFS